MRRKNRKRSLLLSLLSLLLCTAMMIGSTFAWFADTVQTSVNTIHSGTLDVKLEAYLSNCWTDVADQKLTFTKAPEAPQTEAILWEPGCTYNLPQMRIANAGNLALKYKLTVNPLTGDELKLAEVLEVMVDGVSKGSLKDMIVDPDGAAYGSLKANETTAAMTIGLHMPDGAGNDYQGLKIENLSFTLHAVQDTVEYDSFDNVYDQNAATAPGEEDQNGSETP